jgi:hypothetical protein
VQTEKHNQTQKNTNLKNTHTCIQQTRKQKTHTNTKHTNLQIQIQNQTEKQTYKQIESHIYREKITVRKHKTPDIETHRQNEPAFEHTYVHRQTETHKCCVKRRDFGSKSSQNLVFLQFFLFQP